MCVSAVWHETPIFRQQLHSHNIKKKEKKARLRKKRHPLVLQLICLIQPNASQPWCFPSKSTLCPHPRGATRPATAPHAPKQKRRRAPRVPFINKVIHKLWALSSVYEVQVVLVTRELKDGGERWPLTQYPLTHG